MRVLNFDMLQVISRKYRLRHAHHERIDLLFSSFGHRVNARASRAYCTATTFGDPDSTPLIFTPQLAI